MIKYILLLFAPVALQLIGLCFALLVDPYIVRKHRRIMLMIVALVFSLILQNYLDFRMQRAGMSRVRTWVSIFGYSVRPLILVLFFYIVDDRRRHWPGWVLVGINAAIHLTALFSGICFTIDGNNGFLRGPLGFTCHAVSALLLIGLVAVSIRKAREGRKAQLWIPLFNAAVILVSIVIDVWVISYNGPLSCLTISIISASVFYYIWLHLQFVQEHERSLVAEQRIQIMMSQIQPHFLYNTLATIKALCRKDPEMAAEITGKFGSYLRQNLDSLAQNERVPFSKELEHTRIYADIEKIRFDSIRVEYDIQDSSFTVPPLTVQPLVENAIRHGARSREEGVVRIAARRTGNGHEILVQDNGKGFDVQTIAGLDESHIGIRNVQERVEKMCGGTLTIESAPGEGTRATIFIPDEK